MPDLDDLYSDYPHILFKKQWEITVDVAELIGECKAIIRAISETPFEPNYYQFLKGVSLKKGAQATTAIEGNMLTDDEIAKVAKGESLPPSKEYQEIEVRNVLGAMNDLVDEVIDEGKTHHIDIPLLLRFHTAIGKDLGEHFDAIPGRFRTDQRVVGNYRCPRPEHVSILVEEFCNFLAREFRFTKGDQTFSDAVIQAIVAHVYLEWIHPFGDGNGRTGRLLEFYILLRAGNPDIASHVMANHYNNTRPEYYRQLEKAKENRDLTAFIRYALLGFRDGLSKTLELSQANTFEAAWRTFVYEQFKDKKYRKKSVFRRKRELMLEMPINQPMTADELTTQTKEIARSYATLSDQTVKRDLSELIEMELMTKLVSDTGEEAYITNHELLRLKMAKKLER